MNTTNKVLHFEIPVDDIDRAIQFYKEVFDWKINPVPEMNYNIVLTGPTDSDSMPTVPGFINGGIMKRSGDIKHPVITIDVVNIGDTEKKVRDKGGAVIVPQMDVGDMGYTSYIKDTEGNVIGLWQIKEKD